MMNSKDVVCEVSDMIIKTLSGISSANSGKHGLTTMKVANIVNKRWGLKGTKSAVSEKQMGAFLDALFKGGYFKKIEDGDETFSVRSLGKSKTLDDPLCKEDAKATDAFLKKVFGLRLSNFKWVKRQSNLVVLRRAIAKAIVATPIHMLRERVLTSQNSFSYVNKISFQFYSPSLSCKQGNNFSQSIDVEDSEVEEMVGILFGRGIEKINEIFEDANALYKRYQVRAKKCGKVITKSKRGMKEALHKRTYADVARDSRGDNEDSWLENLLNTMKERGGKNDAKREA